MRTLISALVLTAAAPAFAQTAAAPATCSVTIVRAPEQVRATVEEWLAKERCTLALQVRIVPTEGGLYLLATDEHGRVRERIVPDAASAGVLIASWAADDGLGGAAPPPVIAPPPYAPQPYAQPQYPYQPGTGPVTAFGPGDFHPNAQPDADDEEDMVSAKPRHPDKYVAIGGGFGTNNGTGARLEVDLANWGGWTLTGVGSITGSEQSSTNGSYTNSGIYQYLNYDAKLVDYVVALDFGHIWHLGGWHVRAAAGAGLAFSTMNLTVTDESSNPTNGSGSGSMTSPYVETLVMAGHSFGDHDKWAIEVGPVFSYTQQQWYLADSMATMTRDGGNATLVASLRHGL